MEGSRRGEEGWDEAEDSHHLWIEQHPLVLFHLASWSTTFIQPKFQGATGWSQMVFPQLGVVHGWAGVSCSTVCHRRNFCPDVLTTMCYPDPATRPGIAPSKFLSSVLNWSSHCGDLSYGKFHLWPWQCLKQAPVLLKPFKCAGFGMMRILQGAFCKECLCGRQPSLVVAESQYGPLECMEQHSVLSKEGQWHTEVFAEGYS